MNSSQEQNLSEKRAPAQAAEDISRRLINTLKDGGLKVTIDRIDQPAYMVNYNLEITWYNEAARAWLGDFDHLPEESKARHVLQHLSRGIYGQRADNQSVFNKLHWEAGRARLTGTAMAGTEGVDRIDASRGPIMEFPVHKERTFESISFKEYTIDWMGDQIVAMSPPATYLPMFPPCDLSKPGKLRKNS